ncbi:cysteine desulfurase Selenocysteine lyase [Parelaphostrongylus tenuis]|uniref:Cysteine desulfurase Selenocysteine lyase n=1 Tax=Parelaphostrongylus tenuis TaxID=148309 RepID=A0AAD5R0P3_PARTN|nr:cysteine desulfurase Selenocysteine lyase [Parelaphostrongylus tenuis]
MQLQALLFSAILGTIPIFIVQCCPPTPVAVIRAQANMLAAVPGLTPTLPTGTMGFIQRGNVLTITGVMHGLQPGLHGMHVHAIGNLGNGCLAAGDHYNPFNMNHGAPTARVRHVGDLGNIVAGPKINICKRKNAKTTINSNVISTTSLIVSLISIEKKGDGVAVVNIQDTTIRLNGPQSVIGRTLIIHAMRDDLGLGGSPLSLTTGDSGARVMCGIIQML